MTHSNPSFCLLLDTQQSFSVSGPLVVPCGQETGGGHGLVAKLCLTLCNPWTVAHQPPLSMGFSRQEYWSGLPFPSPEDLPDPRIEPVSPVWQGISCITNGFFTAEPPGEALVGMGLINWLPEKLTRLRTPWRFYPSFCALKKILPAHFFNYSVIHLNNFIKK